MRKHKGWSEFFFKSWRKLSGFRKFGIQVDQVSQGACRCRQPALRGHRSGLPSEASLALLGKRPAERLDEVGRKFPKFGISGLLSRAGSFWAAPLTSEPGTAREAAGFAWSRFGVFGKNIAVGLKVRCHGCRVVLLFCHSKFFVQLLGGLVELAAIRSHNSHAEECGTEFAVIACLIRHLLQFVVGLRKVCPCT